MLAFLALLAGLFTGVPSWAGTVRDIRVERGQIVLTFDARVAEASSFILNAPRRIAIDLGGVAPGGRASIGGPIANVRQAARDGGMRIVLDLDAPAIVSGGVFDADGRTLTLTLKTVDDRGFARASGEGRISYMTPARATGDDDDYSVTMRVPATSRPLPLPKAVGAARLPLVVIDAGHGGHDPGAVSPDGRLQEKDLTLKVAKAIRDELVASGRARVALTRDDDRFLVLRERYGLARRMGAALFISIHCDSASSSDASGATVYTLSEIASDKEAARLAARENKADILAGVDLGGAGADISQILIDLTQRETMNTSASFARVLGREARPLIPTKPVFHRMASLMVLKAPDVPSILFETGYISNQRDADFLNSREGREKVAQSVRRAVEVHFATRLAGRSGDLAAEQ
ncbi:N-acetylmuramoyl-L-alanine amidase [Sphingomonas floccifaciens]|uniref:N-acetylmuramoyl-L-alanine amidase n=1 Tax=Sphingomonas floccifaciens TaxID=1844115 RepID=A0ABW4NBZ6_9SPHN